MTPLIAEIFEMLNAEPTRDGKIAILQKWKTPALEAVLKHTYDKTIQFRVNEFPSYKPDNGGPIGTSYTNLYTESSKFYRFLDVKQNKLTSTKIIVLLIQLCEALHAREAVIVKNMIVHRKQEVAGLTPLLINEAFPGLISKPKETTKD
jgi:hypothetical protein